MVSPMKKLLAIIILSLCFITPSQADDIRDFQIEGMSVGDSLLDYFSEEELKKYKRKTAFKDKTYSRYLIINHKNHTKFFGALRIYTKSSDKTYQIYSLAGMLQYSDNYEGCLKELKTVVNDIDNLLADNKNFYKKGPEKIKLRQDKSKKSFKKEYRYIFETGDKIVANCMNWSDKMRFKDMLNVSVALDEYIKWNVKAFKNIKKE